MKKFKKALSLLMISTMLILPTSISVIAKETIGVNSTKADPFESFGTISGDGVRLRNASGTILESMSKDESIYIDYDDIRTIQGIKMVHCLRCKTGTTGYVATKYVNKIYGKTPTK